LTTKRFHRRIEETIANLNEKNYFGSLEIIIQSLGKRICFSFEK